MEKQVAYKTTSRAGRVWLEGKWLHEFGFTRGARYRCDFYSDQMVLVLDPEGNKKVSGKTKGGEDIAVLDLHNAKVKGLFEGRDKVRVQIVEGLIHIS